jgi:large subunit ribosomal protein L20
MPRTKGGPKTKNRRRKRLKLAKGAFGGKSRLFRTATELIDKGRQYAFRDRRARKRNFRRLWIARISAAARMEGVSYSQFMAALHGLGIGLNRKVLADLAVSDPGGFSKIVGQAKTRIAHPAA